MDAYLCIAFLGILLTLSVLSCMNIDKPNYLTAYTITATAFGVIRIIWLIIGAVMFWGYLYPKSLCSAGFAAYMWALLIIGFLGIVLYYLLGFTYPRINSLPVKVQVPASTNLTNHPTNIELRNKNTSR